MEKGATKKINLDIPGLARLYDAVLGVFASKKLLSQKIMEMEEEKKVIERQYEEVNRLNEELNKTMKRLLAVQDMAKAILSLLNLEQLLSTIMNILSDVCRANRTLMMLTNDIEECLEYAHCTGFPKEIPGRLKNYRVPLNDQSNILARVASTGVPEHLYHPHASIFGKDKNLSHFGKYGSLYIVPLITRSKVIGILLTYSNGTDVPEDIRDTLKIFAPQIAIAIENARLYRVLQDQLQELEKSHAMLRRADRFAFLTNLSERLANDIKEPITKIGKFIRMLPDNFDDEEFRSSFYEMALEGSNRVNNLISELLSLVRSKEAQFEMAYLHDLLERTIFLISPHYNAKRITIVRNYDPSLTYVWIDVEKIKQVFLNIISNAVDFTPHNGKIEISTAIHTENGSPGFVSIKIRDNGRGISKDIINQIFDPYFSTKSGEDYISSGGLGLFVALQNIQDHKGSIDVESKEGEGTTFIVKLPVASS